MQPRTDPDLSTATPSELLLLACRLGRTDLVVSALRSAAPLNPPGTTPLHIALSQPHIDITRALLSAGARLSAKDASSQTPVDIAADNAAVWQTLAAHVCQRAAAGDVEAVRDAAVAGLDLCRPDVLEGGNTPLHWAAAFGQVSAARVLLAEGVPPDVVNGRGETPLMDAVKGGFINVARILIGKGANTTLRNKKGESVVDMAVGDEMKELLEKGGKREQREERVEEEAEEEEGEQEPNTPHFVPGERFTEGVEEEVEWGRLLWPRPRRFTPVGGGFTVPPLITVSVEGRCMEVGRLFVQWIRELLLDAEYSVRLIGGGQGGLGEAIAFKAVIFLRIDEHTLEGGEQSYKLSVRDFGIDVVGGGLAGVFYGCATLLNLLRIRKEQAKDASAPVLVPTFCASDWPAMNRRGLYLDVSGRRLPSLKTLKRVVEFMAREMKMNQLQLDVGANFARLESLRRSASLRHEDLLALGDVCREHFVELVPVIGTKPLTETTPDSFHGDLNGEDLMRDTRTKELLEYELLYDEFLPLFKSQQVNTGELSHGLEADFTDLQKLRTSARSMRTRGKHTIHVFGDKIVNALEDASSASGVLAELPSRCIIIVEAKERNVDRFQQSCNLLQQYGLAFYTCSSSYLDASLAGRTSLSVSLSHTNVKTALEQGAAGVLMKDTSASSEGAPLVFLFQSLITFAGIAWNAIEYGSSESPGSDDFLSSLYDMYVYKDPINRGVLGSISVSLGNLHQIAGDQSGVALYNLMAQPQGEIETAMETMSYLGLRRALKRAERIETALSSYTGNADKIDVQELRVCAILLGVAARIGASLFSVSSATTMDTTKNQPDSGLEIQSLPDGRRSDLCNALLQGIELMRAAWIERYHEEGFTDTVQLVAGEMLTMLANGMPYEEYLEQRKAEGWTPDGDN